MRDLVRSSVLVYLMVFSYVPFALANTTEAEVVPYKLAFVIGNSNYSYVERLPNARNDAEDVSSKLASLGFKVVVGYDVARAGVIKLIRSNIELIDNAEAVLFYFAGHGFQFEGKNYLVPIDAAFETSDANKVESETIGLDAIIRQLQDRDRPTMVFLDACRDNPIGGAVQNGLAQVEVGDSTFVAFATQPGNVTLDGTGRNSPFTTAFLQHVTRPGLSISDLMIEIRKSVEKLTLGTQTPWDQSSLRQQFYFTGSVPVDPELLANNFKAILNDPKMRAELQLRMASLDPNALHQFILLNTTKDAAELSRSTDAAGSMAGGAVITSSSNLAEATEVAALQSGLTNGLSNLLRTNPNSTEKQEREVLVRRVQTELARLGCYRLRIDGDWGPGSRRALSAYYAATKQKHSSLDPTIDVLTSLFLHTGRLCKVPKRVVRRKADDDGFSGGGRSSNRANSKKRVKKPVQLPPDISVGVGIGGIF